jgi:hypothetical protein
MKIDTTYYERCINTLEKAYSLLVKANRENIDYDMYRSACIKEFEIILELSGKLLRKVLKPYLHSSKAVDSSILKMCFARPFYGALLLPKLANIGWNTEIIATAPRMITE